MSTPETAPMAIPTSTGTEMETCLDAAADAADAERGRWQVTNGPDSGVGLDWWFVHRDRPSLFVRVNLDQCAWSWEAQDEDASDFAASGRIEVADAGEDGAPDSE